jgi:Tfp pilus assembly protein PilV
MRRTSGFTLVETIVAIVVLIIAALGLGGFTAKSLQTTQDNSYKNGAVSVGTGALADAEAAIETNRGIDGAIDTTSTTLKGVTGTKDTNDTLMTCFSTGSCSNDYGSYPTSLQVVKNSAAALYSTDATKSDAPVKTVSSGNNNYTYKVTTLMTTCYLKAPANNGDGSAKINGLPCLSTSIDTEDDALTGDDATRNLMIRPIIIVQWENNDCTSGGTGCMYVASSLIHANTVTFKE